MKGRFDVDFLELAKKRCSVRSYMEKQVEQEKIEKILEAGRVAPTAANKQPQKILVIQSEEGMEKLGKACNNYGAPLFFVVCSDHTLSWKRPFDDMDADDIDASIVTTHMMLQATELDLDSIWICYFNPDALRAEFAIPKDFIPINLLGVGYASRALKSSDRHLTQRKPLSETVFYETFEVADEPPKESQ